MNRMIRWKRLAVWAVELTAQSAFLIVPLSLIGRPSGHITMAGFLGFCLVILGYFYLTGYVFTTAISRFVWNKQQIWSYPAFNALLFLVHFEILNLLFENQILTAHSRPLFAAGGMGGAFVTSLLGSYVLKHWDPLTRR
jgi:hypothetical protein